MRLRQKMLLMLSKHNNAEGNKLPLCDTLESLEGEIREIFSAELSPKPMDIPNIHDKKIWRV